MKTTAKNTGFACYLLFCLLACSNGTDGEQAANDATMTDEAVTADAAFADQIFTNARIYTLNSSQPWAESIAVKDGRILAVGTAAEVDTHRGNMSELVDVEGRMLMPGIHDMHNHPTEAGIRELYECGFPLASLEEVITIITECKENTPAGEWIRGGQWSEALFATDQSPRSILDEISTQHPIYMMDWTVHNAWVNSAALERFGIDANTPDPGGGIIGRDPASGEATGILYDNAAYLYRRQLPAYTQEQLVRALTWSIGELIGFGVTSFKDAIVTEDTLKAYHTIDQERGLPARVKASLTWKSAWAESNEKEIELIASRGEYSSEMLDTEFAKIMLDGIPLTYTSALLEPYLPSEGFGDNHYGAMMLDYDELIQDVVELDRQGITVKIHATGDRSVRSALDAFEAARAANGDSGLVHEVSHAAMIHPDDLPRFKALNVAAEMCPILWYPWPDGGYTKMVGEERAKAWAIRTLTELGGLVIYGSDWPAVVPDANPWPGIEAMVTRANPYGLSPGADWPEQAVDLETAVQIFTLNGATAAKTPELTGSLEVGKAADFIVLDRNIFEVPIEEVSDTQVMITVVNGNRVYER